MNHKDIIFKLMTINQFKEHVSSSDNFSYQDGIWYSSNSRKLSYPDESHDDCFEIEENSFWFHHRNNCLLSVIRKYSPDSMFFDVGGGNGYVSKVIEDAKIPTVLVEPGRLGALNARKRNLENIFCGTISDLKGLSGQIPAIGTFDVIEHIEDDDAFVKEVYQLLKNDGTFFVTVPAFQILWSDEDTDAGHFRRYSRKKIVALLKKNNFEVVYSTYLFSFLTLPLFFIRTLPSKLGIRKKSKTQTQSEHSQNSGFIGKVLDAVWSWELGKIDHQRSIPIGTSCLIVAKKKPNGVPVNFI
jgi:2-polyprenyl-3-methyl-5-hydroxy-6-metoxy-1,4-benzoquinol methylase